MPQLHEHGTAAVSLHHFSLTRANTIRNCNASRGCTLSSSRLSRSCCGSDWALRRHMRRASSIFRSRTSTRITLPSPQRRHRACKRRQHIGTGTHHWYVPVFSLLSVSDPTSVAQARSSESAGNSTAGLVVNGSYTGGGGGAEEDGATDSADEFPSGAVAPSPPTGTRSVSATLQYEREQQRPRGVGGASKPSPRSSNASDSRTHHRNSHPQSGPPQPPTTAHQQQHQQQHNARDTFLNYFFGQNGPGPVVAAPGSGGHPTGPGAAGSADGMGMPFGREASSGAPAAGAGTALLSGLSLAGKLDGNSAAYDMKSLGKHIEAVNWFFFFFGIGNN